MSHRAEASALVEEIVELLAGKYIFPDCAAKAASLLRAHLEAGAYDLSVGPDICQRISADLYTACEDKHLRLIWYESAEASQDEASLVAALREMFRLENQGIRRVERLLGNVGVIELTLIPEAEAAGPAITAAMQLVQHTHAPRVVAGLGRFLPGIGEVLICERLETYEYPGTTCEGHAADQNRIVGDIDGNCRAPDLVQRL